MATPGYVLKNRRTTLERAEKFIDRDHWKDYNLFYRQYPKTAPLKSLMHYAAPGRIKYSEVLRGQFSEAKVGQSFGKTWSTHWFRLEVAVPPEWAEHEVVLVWDSNSEAMVWKDGAPLQGLTPENKRTTFPLSTKAGNLNHTLYVEMACNELFGAGEGSQIAPPNPHRNFTLSKAHVAQRDTVVYHLMLDFEVLIGFIKSMPEDSNRGNQALQAVNEMVNLCVSDNHSRAAHRRAREVAEKFFSEKNGDGQMTVCAIGNCHIDSAWLWPYAETIRKCARSWSSTIRLLEQYPNFTFACSQAQQFEWVKDNYPTLFDEMKVWVEKGRFLPVGGCWVEMDGNIPSGEGFVRQFLYGQQFFMKEFGVQCKEFWLPDTFGYSAQLPQIMTMFGIERFVTQKMSWNLVNKFPHNTFWWAGIDGSKVLSHFPPGDCYTMEAQLHEVVKTLKNFKDKGRSNQSMFLYGWGDGGQGPTPEMIERLERMKDMDGLPKVEFSTPEEFFHQIEAHESDNLCHWTGELYLELHNGTYTSQAKTKKYNRSCELLLRDVEILSSLATVTEKLAYPSEELLRIWKLVLLNQFHDVLPGSSIQEVYKDAIHYYKDVTNSAKHLLHNASQALLAGSSQSVPVNNPHYAVINTLSWPRSEVVIMPASTTEAGPVKKRHKHHHETPVQIDRNGELIGLVEVPGLGYGPMEPKHELPAACVAKRLDNDQIELRSNKLRVVLDQLGRVIDLFVAGSNRSAIAEGHLGNQLVIHDDMPLYWDAWDVMDYHMETRKTVEEYIQHAEIRDEGPYRVSVEVNLKISESSYIKQFISLDMDCPYIKFDTEVHWHENHKFLKVEFPANVLSPVATYEIQYGHLQRPTHMNTSWDSARFEVCGHKWADVSEYNFGLAVLNDSKYGWSAYGNILKLSLLRSPKAPDEKADMGVHNFSYAAMPHSGSLQESGVIQAAYQLNSPLHTFQSESNVKATNFITVDNPAIIVSALKKAEDVQNGLVLRLYEAFGGSTATHVKFNIPVKEAHLVNGLEQKLEEHMDHPDLTLNDNHMYLHFKPFQILSVLLLF